MNGYTSLILKSLLALALACITGSVTKLCGDMEGYSSTLILLDERARVQAQTSEWNALKLDRVLLQLGAEPPPKPPLPDSAIRRE